MRSSGSGKGGWEERERGGRGVYAHLCFYLHPSSENNQVCETLS